MLQAAKVRLRRSTRVFTFLARDIALARGDDCVVRTERGLELGTCIVEPDDCSDEMAKRYTMPVVRKATYHDQQTYKQIVADEQKARQICIEKIRERQLDMSLVDVEYTFDRHKVVFYFTAEDRVDFRELVRDLAHDLKARIELRHIQVRDKAKIVGGFAACGRELCCSTWLTGFMPISMKMAKRQNLSLNPAKISGQCGRLMCCLSYENDMYEGKRKAKPVAVAEETEEAEEWGERVAEDEAALAVAEGDLEEEEAIEAADEDAVTSDGAESRGGEGGAKDSQKKSRRRRRRRKKPHAPGGAQGGA